MALVSMKTDDSCAVDCSPNPYGYGLRLRLNDDQCEALGIKAALAAGAAVMVTARAVVTEATQRMEADGDDKGPDITLELQITDMAIKAGGGGLFENSNMEP
jgi:hypothetical protein